MGGRSFFNKNPTKQFKPKLMFITIEYQNCWSMIKLGFWNVFKIWTFGIKLKPWLFIIKCCRQSVFFLLSWIRRCEQLKKITLPSWPIFDTQCQLWAKSRFRSCSTCNSRRLEKILPQHFVFNNKGLNLNTKNLNIKPLLMQSKFILPLSTRLIGLYKVVTVQQCSCTGLPFVEVQWTKCP